MGEVKPHTRITACDECGATDQVCAEIRGDYGEAFEINGTTVMICGQCLEYALNVVKEHEL